MTNMLVLNPLGFALAHYQKELASILTNLQFQYNLSSEPEPSQSNSSRLRWVLVNFLNAYKYSKSSDDIIALWPVLGYYDLLIYPMITGKKSITWIMHDPKPLTKAFGYGRIAKFIVAMLVNRNRIHIVVHSKESIAFIPSQLQEFVSVLPHPILTHSQNRVDRSPDQDRNIRVLGQFKHDRNIDILKEISTFELDRNLIFEICGRNWPSIDGWRVDSRFLTEDTFTKLLRATDLVLIPYIFFFQSGVAIRCLEERVPFMISVNNFSKELLGEHDDFLLYGDIEFKIKSLLAKDASSVMDNMYEAYRTSTITAWSDFFAG